MGGGSAVLVTALECASVYVFCHWLNCPVFHRVFPMELLWIVCGNKQFQQPITHKENTLMSYVGHRFCKAVSNRIRIAN